MTQPGQHSLALLPLVEEWYLPDRGVVAVSVERHIARVPTVRHTPADPHQDVPVDEAVVRSADQIPGDWDTLWRKNT